MMWPGRSELSSLSAQARSGVPDLHQLTASFPGSDIEAAIGTHRVFFGLVEVRPSSGNEADPIGRVILVRERLDARDLEGAVAIASQLEGEALAASQAWLVQAQARLAVDDALTELRSALIIASAEVEVDPT